MKTVNAFIGKDLLDMLMFSMYPDAKIIYREYVQNAFDSINAAVKEGLLNKVKDGVVSIKIDQHNRTITILDNGTGIPTDKALDVLTSIADSTKNGEEQAGVYGIGRLVGAGYCSKLEFKTSAAGEAWATIVSFDVNKTRRILDDDNDRRSATEVVNDIVSFDICEEKTEKHYFEVNLHNVKEEYPILLSEDTIIEYLKDVAPIDYEMPFKNNVMYTSLEEGSEYESLQMGLRHIKLSVNDHLDIRKRYSDTVLGTGDEIVGLEYFILEDESFGQLAWGWFAVTKFSKAIPASDPNRCIRLRKHNIQVGESNYLNQYFDEARGNNYFYGEIHAVHPNLKPNASRAGLTPTKETEALFNKLSDYFKNLKNLYTLANKAKTAARDIITAKTKISQSNLSDSEKKEAQATLSFGEKRLQSAAKAAYAGQNKATKTILEIYQNEINTATGDQQKNVSVVESPEDIQKHGTPTANDGGESLTATTPNEQDKIPVSTQDIFHSLAGKYSKDQVWIIRRVFKSLSDNCTKSMLPVIEDLKKLVIKDLEK